MPKNTSNPTDYWYLLSIAFLTGGAVMAAQLIGAALIAPYYGNSLYVWSAVLAVTLGGMAAGYFAGGMLSIRSGSRKTLRLLLLAAAFLVAPMPAISSAVMEATLPLDLGLGITLSCLAFLFLPLVCLGTFPPLIIRLTAGEPDRVGRSTGTVYAVSTIGGIVFAASWAFYLIPYAGLKISSFLAAAVLLIPTAGALIRDRSVQNKPDPAPERQPTAGTKLPPKRRSSAGWLLLAFLEGGVLMTVEIIGAKMLAPLYGDSLFIWASVIIVTIGGLAGGYFLGGKAADGGQPRVALFLIFLAASAAILLMPLTAGRFVPLLAASSHLVAASLFSSLLLILPPALLLGMVSPVMVRIISPDAERAGRSAGMIFGVSTLGGILSSFLAGFALIPAFGLTLPALAGGLALGAAALCLPARKRRILVPAYLAAALVLIALSFRGGTPSHVDVLAESEGLMGQVLVVDLNPDSAVPHRVLFVNRVAQSWIHRETGTPVWSYVSYLTAAASTFPAGAEVLLLGLGGGTVARELEERLDFSVDAVELDPRIAAAAKDHFGLPAEIEIIVDDARHHLRRTKKKYDLVIFDLARGEAPPAHVLTLESFRKVRSLLKPGGMVMVNFNGFLEGEIGRAGRALYQTLREAGFQVRVLPTPEDESHRNIIYLAGAGEHSFAAPTVDLRVEGSPVSLEDLFLDPDAPALKEETPILTDDRPVLGLLSQPAALNWRRSYNRLTESLTARGVPLFR